MAGQRPARGQAVCGLAEVCADGLGEDAFEGVSLLSSVRALPITRVVKHLGLSIAEEMNERGSVRASASSSSVKKSKSKWLGKIDSAAATCRPRRWRGSRLGRR